MKRFGSTHIFATLSYMFLATGCAAQTNCAAPTTPEVSPAVEAAPQPEQKVEAPVEKEWLTSWKDTPTRQRLIDFVKEVTDPQSSKFVQEQDRISVFDNDGTLWVESPIYTQLTFSLDRIKTLSGSHPEWKTKQPFQTVLEGDPKKIAALDMKQLAALVMAAHAETTSDEFSKIATEWFKAAKHPQFDKPYTELIYQPMLELLEFLRASGFKTYIVTGGGVEFVRAIAPTAYGIEPEQVIGTSLTGQYDAKTNQVVRTNKLMFLDDGPEKAVSIDRVIGKRPILAFGNSDGDYEMIKWSTGAEGARLGAFVHHTDAVREAAYDRDSHVGKLARGLDDAAANNWLIVDMKQDWLQVFPQK